MSKFSLKSKFVPKKKRKRGNISDILKLEKEMKPHKNTLLAILKFRSKTVSKKKREGHPQIRKTKEHVAVLVFGINILTCNYF
jgi:hypothetical protein